MVLVPLTVKPAQSSMTVSAAMMMLPVWFSVRVVSVVMKRVPMLAIAGDDTTSTVNTKAITPNDQGNFLMLHVRFMTFSFLFGAMR